MNIDRIKDLAIDLISEVVANSTKDNAYADLEYIRGITDLLAEIDANNIENRPTRQRWTVGVNVIMQTSFILYSNKSGTC